MTLPARLATATALATALVTTLGACGTSSASKATETVVGKTYWPSRTSLVREPVNRTTCTTVRKKTRCRTTTIGYRSAQRTNPARWEITLRAKDGRKRTITVSQSEYDRIRLHDRR